MPPAAVERAGRAAAPCARVRSQVRGPGGTQQQSRARADDRALRKFSGVAILVGSAGMMSLSSVRPSSPRVVALRRSLIIRVVEQRGA